MRYMDTLQKIVFKRIVRSDASHMRLLESYFNKNNKKNLKY